jgi:hypothetical protein
VSTIRPDIESQAMHDHSTRFQFGTPIGVDVGRRQLIAAAPATVGADLDGAITIGNRKVEGHYATLQERHEGSALADVDDDVLAAQLDAVLTATAHEALAYAQSFDSPPMLALEDLDYAERSLAECVTEGRGPDCWLFPGLQERLIEAARAAGIPIAFVSKKYTTKECHVCGMHSKVRDQRLSCTNERCPVETACRDCSAAATIAKRLAN